MVTQLPTHYTAETRYAAESLLRESPDGEWQTINLVARRLDQAITASSGRGVIQGDLHWTTEDGQVIFESSGLYGVDFRTRKNLAGYGDVGREGQFLFPRHLKQVTYTFWDPMFIGPRTANFDRVENLEGLTVYVFQFSGSDMDETEGYSYLPLIPERYLARTDGRGRLWIEPTSGVIVDYEEQGMSYFVDPTSGEQVADLFVWSDRYTPETRATQLSLARASRMRILAAETWLPGGFLVMGVVWLVITQLKRRWKKTR